MWQQDNLRRSLSRRRLLQWTCGGSAGLVVAASQSWGRTSGQAAALEVTQSVATEDTIQPFFTFEVVTVNHQGTIVERRPVRAQTKREDLGGGVELELVGIPGGTFVMGSPEREVSRWEDEGPQHAVRVPSFWMGKHEVTQAQWRAIATFPKVERDLDPNQSMFAGDNRPVETVTWYDAVEFCQRLSKARDCSFRLPSEAEWEYACRAGSTTPFHFGQTISTDLANYRGKDYEVRGELLRGYYGDGPRGVFRGETMDVGSFPPNGFGLYDMHGNVWEWCADCWHESYVGAPQEGTPWIEGGVEHRRVVRGGSWDEVPERCRSANRPWFERDVRMPVFGFRVACSSARPLSLVSL